MVQGKAGKYTSEWSSFFGVKKRHFQGHGTEYKGLTVDMINHAATQTHHIILTTDLCHQNPNKAGTY